jgi:hypothetical protein
MAAIADAAGAAARWGDRSVRLARFRGDGWQWVAPEPRLAMRAALVIRASLRAEGRAFDTRISIGIGPGSLPSYGELAAASGPAFQLSGRGLDEMGRSRRLALAWAVPPACAGERRALVALVDEIARRWTPAQAAGPARGASARAAGPDGTRRRARSRAADRRPAPARRRCRRFWQARSMHWKLATDDASLHPQGAVKRYITAFTAVALRHA